MRKEIFFNILAGLLAVVLVLQVTDVYFGIYKYIGWWDTATHFLGGVWMGGVALWFFATGANNSPRSFSVLFISFGAALIVGLGWELYEVIIVKIFNLAFPFDYVRDTITDLIADMLGGLVAGFLFFKIFPRT
ncbi:MAG: hypothetical protein HYS73_00660 [Parcubacteria group bacterium]|nr:hypothetical protein [Parcubacteria group bacterium]MBI2048945.1 hypothetical protein [Parcubacteria group bacterium]